MITNKDWNTVIAEMEKIKIYMDADIVTISATGKDGQLISVMITGSREEEET